MGVHVESGDVARLAFDLGTAPARVQAPAAAAVDDYVDHTERDAQALAPVFTGRLKAGIHGRRAGLLGEVVSDEPYSEYVEDGTSDTAPQPFMGPAHERNIFRAENGLGDAGEGIL